MSCKYKDECPSYTGWCDSPKQDFSNCVSFLISAYLNRADNEFNKLLERFRHLLESDTIKEYDEVNKHTGNYKKDIKELDKMFKKFTEVNLTTAPKPEPPKNQYCKVDKEPLTVNININGLDELKELIEQWNPFNYKNIKCDCRYEHMSIEEQDAIIYNLLQDRYRWIKEDPRTIGEDEIKYKEQIEYLYNLYKNKIILNDTPGCLEKINNLNYWEWSCLRHTPKF